MLEEALRNVRAGRLSQSEQAELAALLRGTLALKSRRALERVLALHAAAARLGWDALERPAARAFARLFFLASDDALLETPCESLHVLQFEQGARFPSLERVKRAAVEAQLRGVAARRARELGAPGALHLSSAAGAHLLDELLLLPDGARLPLETLSAEQLRLCCPPPLRAAALAAAEERRRRLALRSRFPVLARVCAALRGARASLCCSRASPTRVARMRHLLGKGVFPSMR